MTTTKVQTKSLVNKIVSLQAEMAPLEAELAEAKAELLAQMQAEGIDRTDKFHGAYGVLVERTTMNIDSELTVKAWLRQHRLTQVNFMKFDTVKLRQAGALLGHVDGTSLSVTPYVTVKQAGLTKLTKVVK